MTDWGFKALNSFCAYTPEERARVNEIGRLGASAMKKACAIVDSAIKNHNPDYAWITPYVLRSLPLAYTTWLETGGFTTVEKQPRNFRADLLLDGTIAEFQCPGSGWPVMFAFEEHLGIRAEHSQVIQTYREMIGTRKAVWWLYNTEYPESVVASIRNLARACQQCGINLVVQTDDEFNPIDRELGIVIKHPPLPMLMHTKKGYWLFQRWMLNEVEMDPPPHMLFDSKYLLALLHHPKTRMLFTPEERGLCHPTFLVKSMDQVVDFGNGAIRISDIPALTKDKRRFILKYAGTEFHNRYGGRAVYALHKERGEEHIRGLIHYAIAGSGSCEGWIIQPFVEGKCSLENYGIAPNHETKNKLYYTLYRPGYHIAADGKVKHVGSLINLRETWKVHGATDTFFGIIR